MCVTRLAGVYTAANDDQRNFLDTFCEEEKPKTAEREHDNEACVGYSSAASCSALESVSELLGLCFESYVFGARAPEEFPVPTHSRERRVVFSALFRTGFEGCALVDFDRNC